MLLFSPWIADCFLVWPVEPTTDFGGVQGGHAQSPSSHIFPLTDSDSWAEVTGKKNGWSPFIFNKAGMAS